MRRGDAAAGPASAGPPRPPPPCPAAGSTSCAPGRQRRASSPDLLEHPERHVIPALGLREELLLAQGETREELSVQAAEVPLEQGARLAAVCDLGRLGEIGRAHV